MKSSKVLLMGASVRALAQSVCAAGDECVASDLFADRDLQSIAHTRPIPLAEYPHGFIQVAKEFPGLPRIYTGALENYPDVIEQIRSTGPLWGNPPEVLRLCRDRDFLTQFCRQIAITFPECRDDASGVPADGSWLVKPRRGSAGLGIRRFTGGQIADGYLQEWRSGIPLSAVYVALSDRTVMLGQSRQLVGETWLNAQPFSYCGSVPSFEDTGIEQVGIELAAATGVKGLFNIDFLWNENQTTIIEVNPRWSASMEIFDPKITGTLYGWHRSAFGGEIPKQSHAPPAIGKAILFASREIASIRADQFAGLDFIADIPRPGVRIENGDPIVTLFADGPSPKFILERLQSRAKEVKDRLGMP